VLVLELGDIARFAHAKPVASYIGLTPRIRASVDRIRTGRITKEGNRLLRWVLVLAATQAVRRPAPLRTWFHAEKQRRGRNGRASRWPGAWRNWSITSGNRNAITSWARTSEEMTGARPLDDDASRVGSKTAFVPRPYTLP
jgi:hypothetical protein